MLPIKGNSGPSLERGILVNSTSKSNDSNLQESMLQIIDIFFEEGGTIGKKGLEYHIMYYQWSLNAIVDSSMESNLTAIIDFILSFNSYVSHSCVSSPCLICSSNLESIVPMHLN